VPEGTGQSCAHIFKRGAEVLGGGAEGLVAVPPVRLLAVGAAVAPLLAPPAHQQRLAVLRLAPAAVPAHLTGVGAVGA
jgi:hypothetical protein